MATISTVARTKIADDFAAAFDRLEILHSDGTTVLATITVTFGAAASGVTTVDPASVNASATGTATTARLYKNGTSTREITGLTVSTVAAGTGQVQLISTSITSGQPVDLSSVTYTAPSTI